MEQFQKELELLISALNNRHTGQIRQFVVSIWIHDMLDILKQINDFNELSDYYTRKYHDVYPLIENVQYEDILILFSDESIPFIRVLLSRLNTLLQNNDIKIALKD